MPFTPTTPSTAVYWDFENIHLSVVGLLGRAQSPYTPVDPVVSVASVMEYISGFGPVAVNRAYNNWQWYHKYGPEILHHSIQAVQLFPAGRNAKNGADIRMAVDILDDLQRFSNIGRVVIISGDVDFVAVAQRIRQAGLDIIGIGTRQASNKFWVNSCTEFKQYANLLPQETGAGLREASEAPIAGNAASLLVSAIGNDQRLSGRDWVSLASVRPAMLRLDPSFDLAAYGETKFSNFVRRFSELVEIRTDRNGLPEVGLKPGASEASREYADEPLTPLRPTDALKRDFRPFDIQYLDRAVPCLSRLAASAEAFPDSQMVKDALAACLPENEVDGFYDLFRRTCVIVQRGDGYAVPEPLSEARAIRSQVLAGLLGYLDEATPEPITEEEFVAALGGDEDLLTEVSRLPGLADLPVPIQHFQAAKKVSTNPSATGLSTAERLTKQRGIFVPSPLQLRQVAQLLATAAQEQTSFGGPAQVVYALRQLDCVDEHEAPHLYKSIYTAHCFKRSPEGMYVDPRLLRPESVKVQILGRLLAYLEFINGDSIERTEFATLFVNDPELTAIIESLPPEAGLPVPIERRP